MTAVRTVVTAIVAGAIWGAFATLAPAVATTSADDALLVSNDGARFTTGASRSLFPDIGHVVPGDVQHDTLWVRSQAHDTGRLRLDLVDVTADDEALAESLDISFAVDGRSVGTVTVARAAAAGSCYIVDDSQRIAPGATARIDAALHVDPSLGQRAGDDGSDGMLGTVGFRLRASLADDAVPPAEAGECTPLPSPTSAPGESTAPTPQASAELPATGATSPLPTLGTAALILTSGAALALVRTRRRQET